MHKLNRVKVWGLLGVFLLSFAFSAIQPSVARAADADGKSPAEVTRALGYYYTMRRCIASALNEGMRDYTNDELNNFRFLSGYKLPLGTQFINKSTGAKGDWDGNVNCDGGGEYGGWRSDAISALGYSNPRDMLCNVMHPYQSIAADETAYSRSAIEASYRSCLNGQGKLSLSPLINLSKFGEDRNDDDRSRAFNNSVGMEYFGWGNPLDRSGIDLNLYLLYRSSFQQFCQPTPYNGGDVGSDYEKVTIQEPDATTQSAKSVDLLVKKDRLGKTSDVIAHKVLPGTSSTMSCRDMINKLNSTADAATTVLMSMPPEQQQQAIENIANAIAGGDGDSDDDKSSCVVEGVGWIVCPVSNFLAGITDGLFAVMTNLLETSAITYDSPTYATWSVMRNIANVAFVIAFMIIIYSQLTGAGINNYGIKKILPRLIAAAILVNISYIICQVAVDLSNILGISIRQLLVGLIPDSGTYNLDIFDSLTAWLLAGGATALGVGSITIAALGAGSWMAILALLLPVLLTTLFAILTVILVLAARQALIILLIVISPLAFVAFLLPNTEDWFNRWRKLFMTMLLLFPIISLIFGASQLAAAVVRSSADDAVTYLLSVTILAVPLFLTPIIMKFSGGILNRIGGVVNNPNKGPFDRLRKRAERYGEYKANDAAARNLRRKGDARRVSFTGYARRRAERDSIYSSAESRSKEAAVGYIGGQLAPNKYGVSANEAFTQKMAGSTDADALMQARARGATAVEELDIKNLKAAQVILSDARVDGSGLKALSTGVSATGLNGQKIQSSPTMQMAAASMLMGQGREMGTVVSNLLSAAHSAGSEEEKQRILSFTVGQMQSNYAKAKEKQVGLIDEGLMKGISDSSVNPANFSQALAAASAKKAAGLSVDFIASQDEGSLKSIKDGLTAITADEVARIRETSGKVLDTPSAVAKTSDPTYRVIKELSGRP